MSLTEGFTYTLTAKLANYSDQDFSFAVGTLDMNVNVDLNPGQPPLYCSTNLAVWVSPANIGATVYWGNESVPVSTLPNPAQSAEVIGGKSDILVVSAPGYDTYQQVQNLSCGSYNELSVNLTLTPPPPAPPPPNTPPAALRVAKGVEISQAITFSADELFYDYYGLDYSSLIITQGATRGNVSYDGATGTFVYTSLYGFLGTDSLKCTIIDTENLLSGEAVVTFSMNVPGPRNLVFSLPDARTIDSYNANQLESLESLRAHNTGQVREFVFKLPSGFPAAGDFQSVVLTLVQTENSAPSSPPPHYVAPASDYYLNTQTPWDYTGVTWSNAPAVLGPGVQISWLNSRHIVADLTALVQAGHRSFRYTADPLANVYAEYFSEHSTDPLAVGQKPKVDITYIPAYEVVAWPDPPPPLPVTNLFSNGDAEIPAFDAWPGTSNWYATPDIVFYTTAAIAGSYSLALNQVSPKAQSNEVVLLQAVSVEAGKVYELSFEP